MLLLEIDFQIQRDPTTKKKVYYQLSDTNNQHPLTKPRLPNGWQQATRSNININSLEDRAYVIRPDDNLIVIDCDSPEATLLVDTLLTNDVTNTNNHDNSLHYIVIADNGNKHFYFKPTEAYLSSTLAQGNRKAINDNDIKIDLLQNKSLVFPPTAYNDTKSVLQGSLTNLTDLPDSILEQLLALSTKTQQYTNNKGDYEPEHSYKAPLIQQALALYDKHNDYNTHLQPLLALITPSKFRASLAPTYHPNKVPQGQGIEYLQALSTRIASDCSISKKLHTELISLVAQTLWSEPLSDSDLTSFLSNLTTQTWAYNNTTIWRYDPDYTTQPLVSVNKKAYMPLVRDINDDYIVILPDGTPQLLSGTTRLINTLHSANYSLLMNGKTIAKLNAKDLIQNMDTVTISYDKRLPSALSSPADSTMGVFNTFQPTRLLNIIRGNEMLDQRQTAEQLGQKFPTIRYILNNLVADHSDKGKTIDLFEQFLSHKYKTFDYSPLVFHLLGARGIGKDTLIDYVLNAIDMTAEANFNASNSNFNASMEKASFLKHSEQEVTVRTLETIKKFSGSDRLLVERKGKDSYTTRNNLNIIVTTNSYVSIKEEARDRRIVVFSGFKAKKLNIPHIKSRIAEELPYYCLYLRQLTTPTDLTFYNDAERWRDDNTDIILEDTASGVVTRLELLTLKLEDMTMTDVVLALRDMMPDLHIRKVNNAIRFPLTNTNAVTTITQTNERVTTPLTAKECKEHGLANYIKRNTSKSTYSTTVSEFHIATKSEAQRQELESLNINITARADTSDNAFNELCD
jgi:hypothetical protein